jgi:hypothetical protein
VKAFHHAASRQLAKLPETHLLALKSPPTTATRSVESALYLFASLFSICRDHLPRYSLESFSVLNDLTIA